MQIPGKAIADEIEKNLQRQVEELKKKGKIPYLATIVVGDLQEQLSYISSKKKVAEKLGIKFELIHLPSTPSFEIFMQHLKKYSQNPEITGIIIQHPLPAQLQTDSIYNFITNLKEIEGHKLKSPFLPPISLALLTTFKYVFSDNTVGPQTIIDIKTDIPAIKKSLKGKRIVIAGRGITGGQPIGKTLNFLRINYMSINSQTHDPGQYYRDADIIITAVGKKVLNPPDLKPGVILINAGLRRENGSLKGDYDEKEIDDIASYYTPTPGGIGPIDVMYLYKNLIDATEMQIK
jgi:methylenetetrahydrofolate dehydrogenase (NADP+) / methenyltetrahydrofolate cyclohydrolase